MNKGKLEKISTEYINNNMNKNGNVQRKRNKQKKGRSILLFAAVCNKYN